MKQTAHQLIYASPKHTKPEPIRPNLKLYTYKYNIDYGNGMILIAAKDDESARDIVAKRLHPNKHVGILTEIVGATYTGREGIITEQGYIE